MKILFVTLEQSARENLKVLLNNNYFLSNKDDFYTFGMSDEFLSFKDLTNIKISLLNFVNLLVLLYLFGEKIKQNLLINIFIIFFLYLKLKENFTIKKNILISDILY